MLARACRLRTLSCAPPSLLPPHGPPLCLRYKHRVSHGKLKGQYKPLYVDMSVPTKYWGATSIIKAPAPAPAGSGSDSVDAGGSAASPEAATGQAASAADDEEAADAGQAAGGTEGASSKGSGSAEGSRQGGIDGPGIRGERRRRR